jgi:hypothetical protein
LERALNRAKAGPARASLDAVSTRIRLDSKGCRGGHVIRGRSRSVRRENEAPSNPAERDHSLRVKWRLESEVAGLKAFRVSGVAPPGSGQREADATKRRSSSAPRNKPGFPLSGEGFCAEKPRDLADDPRSVASRIGASEIRAGGSVSARKVVAGKEAGRVTVLEEGIVGGPWERGQEAVWIPSRAFGIGRGAFSACVALRAVRFPEDSTLEEIGPEAFMGCRQISRIRLPASVRWIGPMAFCR